jgi:hypothetical protein
VSEFLSPEWLAALAEAAAADPLEGPEIAQLRLVVEQRVPDAPGGPVTYSIALADGRASVRIGDGGEPDVGLQADYATAAALHRGELSAQEAIGSGRLILHGSLDRVVAARRALAELDDRFAKLRTTTTYDHAP